MRPTPNNTLELKNEVKTKSDISIQFDGSLYIAISQKEESIIIHYLKKR